MLSLFAERCPQYAFIVTPALVVTQAHCECCGEPAPAFRLSLDWLLWTVGLEIELPGGPH